MTKTDKDFTEIRKIGNSKGCIIPDEFIKELNLQLKDILHVRVVQGKNTKYLVLDPMKE